ncbi:hypothetical protein AGMMS49992_26380 [Clostridia bacterium]|nr:hypothetical protein AGMMS49992_26380 [Clostridia bacterium]
MFENKTILVVVSKPTDELALAGSIARWRQDVYILFLTDKDNIDKTSFDWNTAQRAIALLNIKDIFTLKIDDKCDDILRVILVKHMPQVIVTHHYSDNEEAYDLVMRSKHKVDSVACFQPALDIDPSKDPFKPNIFVDITKTLSKKIQAYEAYGLETDLPAAECYR